MTASAAARVRSVLAARRRADRKLKELERHTQLTLAALAARTKEAEQRTDPASAQIAAIQAASSAHKRVPKRDQRVDARLSALLEETGLQGGSVLEIGSERAPYRHLFPEQSWTHDRIDPAGGGTLDSDIAACPELPDQSYDVVLVVDSLHRLPRPWDAAAEITRLLRPGGIVYTATVFAWRYLPQPVDYWRFSPECVASLYPGLETLQAQWDVVERRRDIDVVERRRNSDADAIASQPDALGGWRENWRVHHAARKPPTGAPPPSPPPRFTPLPDGLGVGARVSSAPSRSAPVQAWPTRDDSPCPACGSKRGRLALTYPHSGREPWQSLALHGCPACGFCWAPSLSFSLADYYAGAYGKEFKRDALPPPAEFFTEAYLGNHQTRRHHRATRLLDLVARLHGPVGTLLDVGAGPGITLWHSDALTKLAVEPDVHSEPYLAHAGAAVVELPQIRAGSVDAIVTSHFLEHLPIEELPVVLAELRRVLTPGGVLVSEVPGGNLLSHDFSSAVHEPHTLFFTLESLGLVLSGAGFAVETLDARSPEELPPLQRPWYVPADPALVSGRGALTVGCRRGDRR